MEGYCGLVQGFLVSRRPPSGRAPVAMDPGGRKVGPSDPYVVDISSDEEEVGDGSHSPPVARKLRFDDAAGDGEARVCGLAVANDVAGVGEDDGDCVVLDGDPDGAAAVGGQEGAAGNVVDGSDELQIVAEKGQVACRDFPHSRNLCSNMPFGTTSHEKHCTMCYCFVCDVRAPCDYWGKGVSVDDHCHATDKETKWKMMRQQFKCNKIPASHPEKENLVYRRMVHPTVASVGRLSLANRSPLQNVVNQNQESHTSVRARLIAQPTASASSPVTRAGCGTSNAHTAQVTHLVEPTISAPRRNPAIRAGCGTSNAHTAQVTHLVEPTISAPRPNPAIRARSGTSNVHTAEVTRPLEPTVSAPIPHPVIRAGRVTGNAHTAQITQPIDSITGSPRENIATRAARDTNNGYNSQITHPVGKTVSAPKKYAATRAARDVCNAHTPEIRYPAAAFNYPPEPDRHEEHDKYMTEGEYAPDGTKVYVGNLPYNISNRALALNFERAGAVLSSKVIHNRETGQSRGFGFVTMSTVQEAERAVKIYHGFEVYGRRLIVRKVAPRGATPQRQESYQHEVDGGCTSEEDGYTSEEDNQLLGETKVYVGNLQYDIDSLYVAKLFEYAGIVEHSKVIYDRNTDQSRGFGFVTMSTAEEAERAVEMFHRYEVYGRRLTVRKPAPRPRGARVETPRPSVNKATPRSKAFSTDTPRRHSVNKAAAPRSSMESPRRRRHWCRFGIYVGNLPWQVDDSWLEELFGEHARWSMPESCTSAEEGPGVLGGLVL